MRSPQRYPVSRKILWPDTFEGAARLFVTMQPPRSPVLLDYGDGFPQFLRNIGHGAAAEYIADIAELEAARTAPITPPTRRRLPRSFRQRFRRTALPDMRLTLHPSLSLLRSRFPVVTVWEASQATMRCRPLEGGSGADRCVRISRCRSGVCRRAATSSLRRLPTARPSATAIDDAMASAGISTSPRIFNIMICCRRRYRHAGQPEMAR